MLIFKLRKERILQKMATIKREINNIVVINVANISLKHAILLYIILVYLVLNC